MRGSSVQATSTLKDVWLRQMSTAALNHLPRPVVEVARRAIVLRLRRLFALRVRALGGSVDIPRESFNRWILYRMTREGGDALFSSVGRPMNGRAAHTSGNTVLFEEVLAALPVSLPWVEPADLQGLCKNLHRYASEARALLEPFAASEALEACRATLAWEEQVSTEPQYDSETKIAECVADKLRDLRILCAPRIREHMSSTISSICKDLEQAADAGAADIARLESETTDEVRPEVNVSYQTRRGAFLFAMTGGKGGGESDSNATDESPSADETCTGGCAEEEEELLEQRPGASRRNTGDSGANRRRRPQQSSGDAVFIISSVSFERLAKALRQTAKVLKDAASHDDASIGIAKAAAFLGEPTSTWDLVFCLLCRYDAMCGPGPKEGGGFHSAVPYSVFDAISEVAGVGVESFASPLLTRGGKWKYCSCFGDLDVYFGSLGSFFDTTIAPETIGGTFEANPPFTEAVVEPLVEKVLGSLAQASSTGTPLQFFVVLPAGACESAADSAIERLLTSPFAVAMTKSRRQPFVFGLAFRTDCVWPSFLVRSVCVLLRSTYSKMVQAFPCPAESSLSKVFVAWKARTGNESQSDIEEQDVSENDVPVGVVRLPLVKCP
uniref:PCIF1 WW domain-containing protein n=1 Tax=Noctiluca scintillans TaxID=2966 RepID=A0A7S1F9N7_NOCSC